METDNKVDVTLPRDGNDRRRVKISRVIHNRVPALTDPPEIPANMKPSQTMRVTFPNGDVLAMNRRERRRNKLYGTRLERR